MKSMVLIAANTLRQTIRQRLYYNMAVFGVAMTVLSMVIGRVTFGHPDRVVRSIGLSGISVSMDAIAVLLGVSLIQQEVAQKTVFVVLTQPMRRWQYVAGRYLGLCTALTLALFGFVGMFWLTLVSVGGTFGWADAVVFLMALLEAAILAGIAVCFSCFSTPTLSAGMSIGIWLAAATADDLVGLAGADNPVGTAVAKAVALVLPNLARLNFREEAIYGYAIAGADVAMVVAYGLLYAGVLVLVAGAIFTRREMV